VKKISKAKSIVIIAVLANVVMVNFAFAAPEVIVKAGQLKKINEGRLIDECNVTLATQLGKLNIEGNIGGASKTHMLTSRWDSRPTDPAEQTCLIWERTLIDAPENADLNEYKARYSSENYHIEEGTREFLLKDSVRSVRVLYLLERTAYAQQAQQQFLDMPTDLTKENMEKKIGTVDVGANIVSKTIGVVLSNIIGAFTYLITKLAMLAGRLLSWAIDISVDKAHTPAIVGTGWTLVRDFMNLIFIFALIIMSLATILQVESYNYKRLLARLIIAALLINFSQVIVVAIIDFSNLIVVALKGNWKLGDFAGPHARALANFQTDLTGAGGWMAALVQSGSALVLSVVMLITFLAIAGLMLVRTIGLWFMIILAPAAFALWILPGTRGVSNQIYSTFVKYLIWAPVTVFFLRLGDTLILQLRNKPATYDNTFGFLVVMAFMWGAFVVARKSGMYGGDAIVGLADKGLNKARAYGKNTLAGVGAVGWATAKWGARGSAARAAGKAFNVEPLEKFGKAWEERTAKIVAAPGTKLAGYKYKLWDKPGEDRRKQVDAERRRYQMRGNYLGDFDKDSAAKLGAADVVTLATAERKINKDAGLRLAKVENILEHSPKSTKDALIYAYHQGLIQKKDYTEEAEYNQVINAIRTYGWRKINGRGPVDEEFMATPGSHVVVELKSDGVKAAPNDHTTRAKNMYVNIAREPVQNYPEDPDNPGRYPKPAQTPPVAQPIRTPNPPSQGNPS
jgi:hypothetical protein